MVVQFEHVASGCLLGWLEESHATRLTVGNEQPTVSNMNTAPANTNGRKPTETRDSFGRIVLTLGDRAVTLRQNGVQSDWMAFAHSSDEEQTTHRAFAGKSYKSATSARRAAEKWLRASA